MYNLLETSFFKQYSVQSPLKTPVTFSLQSTSLYSLLPTRVFNRSSQHNLKNPCSSSPPIYYSFHHIKLSTPLITDGLIYDGDCVIKMEDPEYSEWIIQEYSSSKGDEGGSMVKWILNKGYVMVRKIAVTGVVISSAPLVVPPLVVASAMGVAFSVPFGLLFAGYACTNKLMNILLPPPPPPPPLMLEYYNADEYDQPAEMDSMVDSKLGFDDKEDDTQEMDDDHDDDMNHEIVLELEDVSDDYKHEGYLEEDGDSLEYELKGVEPLADENDNNKVEVDEGAKMRDEGEVEDDLGVGESGSNVDFGDVKDVETTKMVGLESDEKPLSESMGTEGITGGSEDAILRTMEEHLIHSIGDSLDIGGDERNTNIDIDSVEVGSEVKEDPAAENVDALTHADDAENASKAYKKMPSKEENLDDEKIWEKIRAMRTLVGYKAPSQPTCIGELKALYVFTGVEPPTSFGGDSDPDEVNVKLKFLMAIVGVK